MSLASSISGLVIPPWLRITVKLLPYGIICALAISLAVTRVTLREARLGWARDNAVNSMAYYKQAAANSEAQKKAVTDYANKLSDRQPIILHSIDTVTKYAATPDGSSPCLPSDRVRGIQEDRDALFPKGPGGGN